MRSRLARCICLSLALVLCTVFVAAHSGGTDSKGGHYNHSTGEYHYHHGYPAHQHTGGVCPYDFDDKTGQSSGSSGSSSKRNSQAAVSNAVQPKAVSSSKSNSSALETLFGCTILFVWLGIPLIRLFLALCASAKDFLIDRPKRQKAAAAEKARLSAEFAERQNLERTEFLRAYQGHRLSEVVPPPNVDDHIDPDGLPCGDGTGRWGTAYTVYVTYHGKVYHRRSVCGTACGTSTNITRTYGLRPCSRCCKSVPPDLTWYYKQQRLLQKSYQLFGCSIFSRE